MRRLAYVDRNYGNVSVTATSEGAATEVLALPKQSFDGSTQVLIELYFLAWGQSSTTVDSVLVLFDNGAAVGELWRSRTWAASGGTTGNLVSRVLTPTAGNHIYSVRAYVASASTFTLAADKVGENAVPMFLRAYEIGGYATGNDTGLRVETGTFIPPGATGEETYTLVDEDFGDVKALLVFGVYEAAAADTDGDLIFCAGIGTDRGGTAAQYCANIFSDDGVGTSATAAGGSTTAIVRGFSAATPTVDFSAALVSLGPAQFRINWTDLPGTAGIRFHYVALGGSAISDALVDTIDIVAATGTQDETVVAGFGKPDLLFALAGHATIADAAANARFMFGVGKSDTEQGSTAFVDQNAGTSMVMAAVQRAEFLSVINNNTTVGVAATLSARASWPTDGFQINKSVAGIAPTIGYLALRGTFTSVIGSNTAPTAAPTVTQDLAVGNTPRGAIFFHNVLPTIAGLDNSNADLGLVGIGVMDGTREGWAGVGQDDSNTTSVTHRHHSESKTVKMFTPSASGTLTSEATSEFSGTNVRLTWADTDTVAREYRYLLLGDATPVSLITNPNPLAHLRAR